MIRGKVCVDYLDYIVVYSRSLSYHSISIAFSSLRFLSALSHCPQLGKGENKYIPSSAASISKSNLTTFSLYGCKYVFTTLSNFLLAQFIFSFTHPSSWKHTERVSSLFWYSSIVYISSCQLTSANSYPWLFSIGVVTEGPPTTRRWDLPEGRCFRVRSSVMKACLWETGTSGRNLKSTVDRLVLCFVFHSFGGEKRNAVGKFGLPKY